MIRQIITLPTRSDAAGDGAFGARRGGGKRTHNGVDVACHVGEIVLSPVDGKVTKHGICYSDDHQWKYVQVTDGEGRRHRLFYVHPETDVGDRVTPRTEVGTAQDITRRYPDLPEMTPHIHYEVKDRRGKFLNPALLIRPASEVV